MKIKFSFLVAVVSLFLFSCNSATKSKVSQYENNKISQATDAVTNEKTDPKKADLSGMVFFQAGKYLVGSENGLPNEKPVHEIELSAFYIDKSPVSVAQFREFINATGFKTEAEKFGDSGVFNFSTNKWELKAGVTWEYPFGKDAEKAKDNHPVTHVSWNDAMAYAEWAGKRLPKEAEWEVAARCGQNGGSRFSWGDQLVINGKYQANVWQGKDASKNIKEDGYEFTSPVGAFGENAAGVTDMGGNVWNWCLDTYQLYSGNTAPFRKDENVKVIRGGSFFFDQNGEDSFTVSGRSFNSHETSLFNTGFRCAVDAE
ncbi:formylglycine-generating enzyme family protein [Sunxiuqinia sp. A32]|uniref:formylglycine-generating enzyme family protein n=1 Tax=Sunxiuqinia sp. A32 TaxID=3461496 RepID=UPI0040466798